MKCIQSKYENLGGGKTADMTITRVTDQEAHAKVSTGNYQYVSKSSWKAQRQSANA